MCGIVGFCNYRYDSQLNIEKMMNRMIHRGPDAGESWTNKEGNVTFGHRRLAIVDLSPNGVQPMTSHSGRYTMVFNGEIYNHRVLAKRLLDEKRVEAFRGTSDTEVLLEAFEQYGIEETISFCKGMFAIALYDNETHDIWMLRDRIGEKPLYYGWTGGAFVFASDIGSIAELDGFDNPLDKEALNIYFVHGYIPAPYSVYKGIYKLKPGYVMHIKAPYSTDDIEMHPYWDIMDVAKRGQTVGLYKGSFEEATAELEDKIKDAISDQMVADVPVGAFLSSGIDSTTIVSLMQSLNSKPIRTFTIGVDDPKYNEAGVAKQIAGILGTDHTEMYISDEDAKNVIPKLGYMFGEPFADSSQIPTYLVSKLTKQHVTVSLSGDAGDELFSGYGSYASIDRIWGKMGRYPYAIRKPISDILCAVLPADYSVKRTKALLLGAKNEADLYERSAESDPMCRKIMLDTKMADFPYTGYPKNYLGDTRSNVMLMDMLMYHPDDILVKVDRCGMAVSLESRIPLLDRDVVEFAWSLPIDYKYKDGVTKRAMRDILYRYVPKEIMDLPKRGFSIPIQKWMLEPKLREWAEGLLDRTLIEKQGILNADVVSRMWSDFTDRGVWRQQIWFILMFQQWMGEQKNREVYSD